MKTVHLSITITMAVTVSAIAIALMASSFPQNQVPVYQYVIHESYHGADKNYGTVTIQNQTFHVVNLDKMFDNKSRPEWIQMYNVNFSFPNGVGMQNTPGGQIMESYVTFPDNPVPYRLAIGLGSSPGTPSYDYTTILSTHKEPQAGFTVHNDTVQLLVNWSKIHSDVSVMGLNDTYRLGQTIDFQVRVHGYDNFDAGGTPDINITKSDGTVIWQTHSNLRLCCVPELIDYDKTFDFANLGGPVVLNETGLYKLVLLYNDQKIQKQFMVTPSGVETKNTDILAAKTYLKQVHYYDSSNLHPKVSLYDYSYDGIDKDGLVSIDNQTFYQTTLDNDIYKLKGVSVQFHNVTFSFPEGTLTTPGGAFVNLDIKFQDGFEEIYGGTMPSPDGSSIMVGGISIPIQYGPHLAVNSITVLGNHTMPQAGLTIYHDKIKLLVSVDDKISTENNDTVNKITGVVPSCVSTIPHQYAIVGPPGDLVCPYANFVASDKILNVTGFYGIYNYTSYPGTLNYVLEPGHNSTIMFLIHMNMIHHNASNIPYSDQINITNDIVFMHDAGMYNHPGVDVLVEPKSQMIGDDGSSLVTMTFSASKDALPGVYWVTLPPGFCVGGQMIILTVTDCEK